MVEGKGGDESAEGGSVHCEKQRTKNGALGHRSKYRGMRKCYCISASDTEHIILGSL